jgi:hypothetical protein
MTQEQNPAHGDRVSRVMLGRRSRETLTLSTTAKQKDDPRPKCNICRHWSGAGVAGHLGSCRRYAPRVVSTKKDPRTIWPETYEHDGCGEYEA